MSGDQGKTGTETGWRGWLGRNWVATLVGILGLLVAIITLIVQWPDDTPGTAGPRLSVGGNNSGAIVTGDNATTTIHQGLSEPEINLIVKILTDTHLATRRADQETIKSLRAAVEALSQRATRPNANPEIRDALEQLKAGDQKAAEAIFAQVLAEEEARGQRALKKAAEAARHLGALAFLHDTKSALNYYRKATRLDPDNPGGWNQLGHLLRRIGELDEATEAYEKVLSIGEGENDREWIAIATGNLGLGRRLITSDPYPG